MEGGTEDTITERIAFSESAGFVYSPNDPKSKSLRLPLSDNEIQIVAKKYLYPRKAIYKDGYKLVLNGLSKTIEEFTFNGLSMNQYDNRNKIRELLNELEAFSK